MAFHKKRKPTGDKVEQMMTPMIDIVFQLLAFFIMTFKVVSPEGDFSISMPSAAPQEAAPDDLNLPPLKIALRADSAGVLQSIVVGSGPGDSQTFGSTGALAQYVVSKYGASAGPNSMIKDTEVELTCDYKLHYEHTMAAVAAVSGYIPSGSDVPITLFEKVKFSRPPQRTTP